MRRWLLVWVMLLGACSGAPPAPAWKLEASDSLRRAQTLYLQGRVSTQGKPLHEVELQRMRQAIASSGQVAELAKAELAFCAAQVAALDDAGRRCDAFVRLQADADASTAAYHRYLMGHFNPADVARLPELQRPAAAQMLAGKLQAKTLNDMTQGEVPGLAALVAASVALQSQAADIAVAELATQVASSHGHRRAVWVWLGVLRKLAVVANDSAKVEQIDRQLALVAADR